MLEINDLLGCRFADHGRSVEEGFDCYGLAIEVSRRLGHELKDLWYEKSSSGTFSEKAGAMLTEMAGKVTLTDSQEQGNLIVFFDESGRMVHIGVFVEEGRFIHADGNGVWINELEYYYRKKWQVYRWL